MKTFKSMATFEQFKADVMKVCEQYNAQNHRTDNSPEGRIITVLPRFTDLSEDGYMPIYLASFLVYWDGKSPIRAKECLRYNIRFNSYTACLDVYERFSYKTIRRAFSKIFN